MAKGSSKKVRLNLLIDEDLKIFVKKYARKKKTKITQLITDYFVALRDGEDSDKPSKTAE